MLESSLTFNHYRILISFRFDKNSMSLFTRFTIVYHPPSMRCAVQRVGFIRRKAAASFRVDLVR
jgi:hypothetical protein